MRYDGFPEGNPQQWGYVGKLHNYISTYQIIKFLLFLDVREGAHMFWWMHFTKAAVVEDFTERPIIFWLQGGPGSSSSGYGNFEILGPVDLAEKERNFTWVNTHNVSMIFLI